MRNGLHRSFATLTSLEALRLSRCHVFLFLQFIMLATKVKDVLIGQQMKCKRKKENPSTHFLVISFTANLLA